MNLYKTYELDARAEQDGRWFTIQPTGFQVKLARSWNIRFSEEMAKEQLAYGKDLDKISEEEQANILDRVMSKTIVLDWKDAQDRDGSPLACTPENVQRILKDLPELRGKIILLSRDFANFRKEQDDATEKN